MMQLAKTIELMKGVHSLQIIGKCEKIYIWAY
jgi:hypothetical protein